MRSTGGLARQLAEPEGEALNSPVCLLVSFRGAGRQILFPFDRARLAVSPCFQSILGVVSHLFSELRHFFPTVSRINFQCNGKSGKKWAKYSF